MSSAVQAELYIYYKLGPAQAEAALAAFEQARGEAPVRLLQRREGEGDAALLTWMEIYGPDVTQAQLVEQRVAAVMAPFAVGARHREVFQALSPAASPAK